MRLYISHEKPHLVFLLADYMNKLLLDRKIDLIINGKKSTGRVNSLTLEDAPHNNIIISINNQDFAIPILEETKARLGKEMVRIETDNHTTIIEILD